MNLSVAYESWRPQPLAWIHRAEARSVTEELRRAGHDVRLVRYGGDLISRVSTETIMLRLSDPVMLGAAQAFTRAAIPFVGPSAAVMERCYDKYQAYRGAAAHGMDCPATALASDAGTLHLPLILKPRCGSDSIGVRLFQQGPVPSRFRTESYIAQEFVRGAELTVAVLQKQVGMPLRIQLPEGTPYSFFRKYLLRPARAPITEPGLAERVRSTALKIAEVFEVDWAARVDLIYETASDRLRFLECDVAPLVGAQSAFAASFEAAGIGRAAQLRMLLNATADRMGISP